jgi:DNA-binding FrmR family transcriptional regulator
MKDKKIDRINRIIGQLEGLKTQIAKPDYDCEAVLVQVKAAMGATRSLAKLIAEEDLAKCFDSSLSQAQQLEKLKTVLNTLAV